MFEQMCREGGRERERRRYSMRRAKIGENVMYFDIVNWTKHVTRITDLSNPVEIYSSKLKAYHCRDWFVQYVWRAIIEMRECAEHAIDWDVAHTNSKAEEFSIENYQTFEVFVFYFAFWAHSLTNRHTNTLTHPYSSNTKIVKTEKV